MTLKLKLLIGAVAALAIGVVGQVVVYAGQPPTPTLHASWSYHPQNLREARDHAPLIVLAEVVSVQRGEDIITQVPGEPDGVDRIPTQRITVKVLKSYKGGASTGDKLSMFQTGGTTLPPPPAAGNKATTQVHQVVLEGDPLYTSGEQYLLMLEAGPKDMLRTISPEGRYRYAKSGALTPMVSGAVAAEIQGKRLAELETTLKAQN